jgi:hypothetical protein
MDIGCGQGLMLALLAEARQEVRAGAWPASQPAPPTFDRMIGFEIRPKVAASARTALGVDAEIIEGDARAQPLSSARAILLFDVLHLMRRDEQDAMLAGQDAPELGRGVRYGLGGILWSTAHGPACGHSGFFPG